VLCVVCCVLCVVCCVLCVVCCVLCVFPAGVYGAEYHQGFSVLKFILLF
jgi:hypothetical protein